MARHENTNLSAERVKEVFDEGKAIPDTAVGEELTRELNAQMERHREQMQVPREGLEQALKEKDEEPRRELHVEIQRLQMKVEWLLDDSKRMASHYKLQINQIKETLRALKLKARGYRQARVPDRLRDGFL
ncbi:hypothetical protein BJ322DRAFT_1050673 [Thelephora terrestris]|uniref:Uncharacterized protein n=1 Tax=Thelephora terrestris TaxID=56493 RepID=A0A9P6HK38_9AGAM|nr:hypothetical protein BJ322DRAFT_1050673 [Thelephora terrestris]